MNKAIRYACTTFLFASLIVAARDPVTAQQKSQTPAKPDAVTQKPAASAQADGSIPIRVQLVISKYKGDKKLSSLPFSLALSPFQRGRLHVGARIPVIASSVGKPADEKGEKTALPYSFNQVGTTVDCTVTPLDQGRFRLDVSVSDESVATPEDATYRPQGVPAFRTFSISGNSLILRDGETGQLTTAADPVTGELMRVDVTFSIVK